VNVLGFGCTRRRRASASAWVEHRHEPVLDSAIRQAIQQELFEKWLADTTREAALDLAVVGMAGRGGRTTSEEP
jgi:hypothetical protein